MHFAKRNIFALAAATMTVLSIGAGAAAANPVATVTIKNESSAPAVYDGYVRSLNAVTVDRAFVDVQPGKAETYTLTSKFDSTLSAGIDYSSTYKDCKWVASRVANLKFDWFSGTSQYLWSYPKVVLRSGSSYDCAYEVDPSAAVSTGQEVTPTNGNFNVTLTVRR